ncbi:SusC/RagA family TonB-linked outer membrane protein [Sinomicrobium soli]|uniref:SusC/RagA family TonB-linked outer membrane protein n=1 Tax=Sinomicrobium sp. N-1-3-6 TaxID=2219864 RepID=UPI000DCBB3E0|nr:TonB-dependent receptor [Sinomicrobium sp. N-1-3-6]RAV28877.1 SusC/RagA family TonB-linked outer membrane protein [Sinomicrobium sp. N-1-3-6]
MKKKQLVARRATPSWFCSRTLFRIMKIYSLLLCLTIVRISAWAPSAYGQHVQLDHKNISLKEVLSTIEKQTDYIFFYNNKIVDEQLKINVSVNSEDITKVLQTVLHNTDIKFRILSRNIVLYRDITAVQGKKDGLPYNDPGLPETALAETSGQDQLTITGTVLDDTGTPLPGVNILIRGTTSGTQTDFDGNFSISAGEGDVLELTYIGFKKEVIAIDGSQTDFTIHLESEADQLSEVIVVAYDSQSKASYTGAAVNVDIKKLEESPLPSFQESLQGNVAGVQMSTQSGQPGAAPNIRIRGIGSINAGSDPLYVIDGIPVISGNIAEIATSSNTIAGLNPKDIASVTVLKDASATAIYGSRGANGVILITTKKGRSGKTTFDFSTQYGISSMILPDRLRPLATDQLSELLVEARVNSGESLANAEDYIYSRINRDVNTDWVDVITRNGQYKQYNLSATGGNEKTTFYSSLGLFEQEGVIIGIDYKKLNAKLNVTHQATDKLKIDFGVSASHQKLHTNSDAGSAANPVRALFRVVPWEPVYNEDGTYNTDILLTYNPVGMVKENIRETKLYGIIGNLGLTYNFTDNLSFESKGNIDFNLADEFQYDNPYFGAGRNDGGRGQAYDNKILNYNITNLLKYRWQIDGDHNLNFILGQEAQKITRSSVYAYASNYGAPGLTTLENASVYREASSSKTASSIASYFFNINYGYKNKYIFNVTARRDGSSRFGSDVRYANFGSVGVAWNISSEDFMDDVSFVNSLKFRSSYGINGNQEIGDFASRGLYATGEDYDGQPGYAYSQQSNPLLTWEKNKPFNIGLDFGLFNRLSGTVEYYTRTTTDLLFEVPISATNGLTSYLANIGEMKNSGWEVSLNSVNIENPEGFGWNTNLNFTSNNNEITKLQDDSAIVDGQYIREIGDDFYTFYMPGYAGVDPDNGDALWYIDETKTATTNRYAEAQPFKQGSALPKFYAGLTNSFTYKNFGLSFLLYLNYGNKVYDSWGRYTNSDGSAGLNDRGNMTQNIYDNRWQQPGDITDVPKMMWGNTQSGTSTQHSTRFLYDGTYMRLRDVTLSYSLPESVTQTLSISSLRFYIKTTNMLTWVRDDKIEIDPEVGIDGQSDLRIPISKQFLFGLDLSF